MIFIEEKDWQLLKDAMSLVDLYLPEPYRKAVMNIWEQIIYHQKNIQTATQESEEITFLMDFLENRKINYDP